MSAYWVMFFIPLFALLYPGRNTPGLQTLLWWLTGIFYALLIGLRFEVGGDWSSYMAMLNNAKNTTALAGLTGISSDPGFALLNWVAVQTGGGIYLVNFACAAVFMTGLVLFCRQQPLPWLGLLIAVPYMIIVLAMGYTRQSVAFGFELLALNALMDRRIRLFVMLIFCGALFHKSAVLLFPLAALASSKNRLWTMIWVGVTSLVVAILLLAEYQQSLWENYVSTGKQSEGGAIRVALTSLPAVLLLMFRKSFYRQYSTNLWVWMAVFTLLCIPLVTIASTAVDRVALYLMPLQIVVFTRLHTLFITPAIRAAWVIAIAAFYGLIQFVWLNFATNAHAWIPYKFAPFE